MEFTVFEILRDIIIMLHVHTIPHRLLTLAFTSHLDTNGGCLIHIVAKYT